MSTFQSRESFIRDYIAKQTDMVQQKIAAYCLYAKQEGARTSNDGYPDTRFKGTYPEEHLAARKFIAKVREYHDFKHGKPNCPVAWSK